MSLRKVSRIQTTKITSITNKTQPKTFTLSGGVPSPINYSHYDRAGHKTTMVGMGAELVFSLSSASQAVDA